MNHPAAEKPMVMVLDTGEVPARWICAEPDEARPYTLDHRSFKTLRAFKRHWRRCCPNRPVQVAAATQTPDPLGILPWLESQGVPVQRYPWGAYPVHLNGDFSMYVGDAQVLRAPLCPGPLCLLQAARPLT
jgi:hypothetical protein